MSKRYFDDFEVGDRFESAGATVTEAGVIDFALRYDPQPFHMDVEAAKQSLFGGLIASGFQTLALSFRLFLDQGIFAACNLGSPGLDEVRWLKPVYPGDTLHVVAEVVGKTPSSSRPDRGSVRMKYTTFNHKGEAVLTLVGTHILLRRPKPAG